MKKITISLYSYDELSEEAQAKAHNDYLRAGDYWSLESEARSVIKEVEKLFQVKLRNYSVDTYRPEYPTVIFGDFWNDDMKNLKGNRARAFLWNNFGHVLLSGRYYSKYHGTKHAHSRFFFDRVYDGTCPLTGICFDCDALDPMAYFCFGVEWSEELKKRVPGPRGENAVRRDNCTTVEGIVRDCVHSLFKSFCDDKEYAEGRESFRNACVANDWTFEEDGTMHNA